MRLQSIFPVAVARDDPRTPRRDPQVPPYPQLILPPPPPHPCRQARVGRGERRRGGREGGREDEDGGDEGEREPVTVLGLTLLAESAPVLVPPKDQDSQSTAASASI